MSSKPSSVRIVAFYVMSILISCCIFVLLPAKGILGMEEPNIPQFALVGIEDSPIALDKAMYSHNLLQLKLP
jgi:hypothetical protein